MVIVLILPVNLFPDKNKFVIFDKFPKDIGIKPVHGK
jgi:hypothetical protein